MYCKHCGKEINDQAVICVHCGCSVVEKKEGLISEMTEESNRGMITLLLCFFLGAFGVHRFYVGKTATGIAMLLTAGGCGIWMLVDLVMIICGNFTDVEGNTIKL